MIDRKRLHNDVTEILARGLHHFENMEKINALKSAVEVNAALEAGIDRYLSETIYHAKVDTLVAAIMQSVDTHSREWR